MEDYLQNKPTKSCSFPGEEWGYCSCSSEESRNGKNNDSVAREEGGEEEVKEDEGHGAIMAEIKKLACSRLAIAKVGENKEKLYAGICRYRN